MRKIWKKGLAALSAVLLLSQAGYADCNDECYDECGSAISFCCDPCSGWSADVDYLYWRTRTCDLDYAYDSSFGGTDDYNIGDVYNVTPRYQSGFRVAIEKECGDFCLNFTYTSYKPDASASKTRTDASLAGTRFFPAPGTGELLTSAESFWDLDYQSYDLSGCYHADLTNCMAVALFGGARMAFIDQKLKTAYGVAADSTSDQIIRQAIDFSGYGPRVGVEGIWKLSRCFSLYSSFAYSLLVAKEERDLSVIEPNGTDDTPFVDLHDSCWNLVSSIDWAVGVKFFEARCSCIDFDLTLGYEFHQYITPKGFLDFQEIDGATPFFDRHLSNLGFDGLFVRLGLVF